MRDGEPIWTGKPARRGLLGTGTIDVRDKEPLDFGTGNQDLWKRLARAFQDGTGTIGCPCLFRDGNRRLMRPVSGLEPRADQAL